MFGLNPIVYLATASQVRDVVPMPKIGCVCQTSAEVNGTHSSVPRGTMAMTRAAPAPTRRSDMIRSQRFAKTAADVMQMQNVIANTRV